MAMPRFGLAIALAIVSVAYVVFVHGPPVRGGYGLPVFYSCPDVLSYIIPAALHCKLCRTAVVSGQVSDCSCDFETVDSATHAYFHPLLTQLQTTPFFRYFKVHLDEACPFWDDSGETCALKDCSVETCEPDEVPLPWRADEPTNTENESFSDASGDEDVGSSSSGCATPEWARASSGPEAPRPLGFVTRVEPSAVEPSGQWSDDSAELWIAQGDSAGMVYVDLLDNPERHTGYEGESPQRIWRAIYEENCFEEAGQCLEKRVFYRLMSGLQSSITTHIASDYFYRRGGLGEGVWGVNTPLFVERVGRHPERLHNLYFAYLFVLRALSKAAPELEAWDYYTGHPKEDARAAALVRALVRPDHPLVEAASDAAVCQQGFDEKRLFVPTVENDWAAAAAPGSAAAASFASSVLARGADASNPEDAARDAARDATALRSEFQARFRNISRIMDCVGCERCRLWGKLQVLGVGTALKVLMSDDDLAASPASSSRGYRLQRNEVIALLNVLAQLSKSVHSVHAWRRRELQRALLELCARLLGLVVAPVLAGVWWRRRRPPGTAAQLSKAL